jgi:hypothetical protein
MLRRFAVLLGLALAALSSACGGEAGSGTSKTEQRDVPEFTKIVVGAGVEADVEAGPRAPLDVTADDNLLAHLKTEVSGGTLSITVSGSVQTKVPMVVHVVAPGIREYDAESGATIKATGVNGDAITLKATSGAKLEASGAANEVHLEATSGAKIDADGVIADAVDADATAGAHASVSAKKSAGGTVSSGAKIKVKGGPEKRSIKESSGGTVSYE